MAGLNRTAIIVAAIGLIGVIGAAVIGSRGHDDAAKVPTTSQTLVGTGNTQIAGNNNVVNPPPVPHACRDKSHGVERYDRVFKANKDSLWMGGGFDPGKWCDQAIAQLARENPDAAFEVIGKSEDSHTTCAPFNCPQYQYHCASRLKQTRSISRRYPLTVTDFASRYLLCCDALEGTREAYAFSVFERAFKDYGLPMSIRSDNGTPFASRSAFFGLSKLSVWWLRLGIGIERIEPGQPQQNGRHERMHLTLKKEATKPPGKNFLQQQARFDEFIQEYNCDRPHQALGMKYPSELYYSSPRPYQGLQPLEYPLHDMTVTVTRCGRLCFGRRKINLSTVFAGQNVGVREVADHVWMISFMHYDLGFFNDQSGRVECAPNPFGAKVLPMSPE